MRRWFGIAISLLAVAGLAGYIWFGNPPPSAPEFAEQKITENIADLVKQPQDEDPPNIIILLADDLGWADVGFHGSDIRTPNIDRLAKEGMRLERFYVMPICTPTRSALMTGRDPIKLGMANAGIMPWNDGGVSGAQAKPGWQNATARCLPDLQFLTPNRRSAFAVNPQ